MCFNYYGNVCMFCKGKQRLFFDTRSTKVFRSIKWLEISRTLHTRPTGSSLVVTALVREVYLNLSTESIVIEIPGWFLDQRERKGAHRAQFPPIGVQRRERAPALVIPRLKASFNIYDLFRFNSTRKREAYLYSVTAWLTRSRRKKLTD